ncbi:MAG: TetR/AcrR family transcriptional regulator [Bacteroidales bacterium]|nr:TetR/AcrR family transcriptional regulator [Bacteroidales bacterium]MCF8455232.1 TetR/AcrR family transcriptional regulator [Bacteroidales bacterium]
MDNTETKIIDAARRVFVAKGLDGARMQEIADEAGINKALLHYYFRSKQKLFDAIFEEAFQQFIPTMGATIASGKNPQEIITIFIDAYFRVLEQNPFLPQFVIGELNRDPSRLATFMAEKIGLTSLVDKAMSLFQNEGFNLKNPQQFMISLISMIIFPFVAKPILHHIIFKGDQLLVDQFFAERKSYVTTSALQLLASSLNENN